MPHWDLIWQPVPVQIVALVGVDNRVRTDSPRHAYLAEEDGNAGIEDLSQAYIRVGHFL